MGQPTTGIYFSASSPAAPPGDQLCVPLTDNEVPEQSVTFYPQQATTALRGTVKPDGTTITMDPDGTIHSVATVGGGGTGGGTGGSSSGGAYVVIVPTGAKDGSNAQYQLPAAVLAGTAPFYFTNGVIQRQLGVNAEFAIQDTQLTRKYPLQSDDWHELYYVQGTPNSESGGGGSVTPQPLTLRGSNIASSNSASSITVSLPTGSAVGDLAVCFAAGAWPNTVPAGWTTLQRDISNIWTVAVFSKILDSGDISAGNVTVNFSGTFDCSMGIVTFIGPTGGVRESEYSLGTSSATITNVTTSAVLNADAIIYFTTSRGASGPPTITPGSGSATTIQTAITTNSHSVMADQSAPGGALSVANVLATPGFGWAAQVVVKS